MFKNTQPSVVVVKGNIDGRLMLIHRLFDGVQINTLYPLLSANIDHQLVPLFDFSGLVVDRIIDTGQEQVNHHCDDQLLVSAVAVLRGSSLARPHILFSSSEAIFYKKFNFYG